MSSTVPTMTAPPARRRGRWWRRLAISFAAIALCVGAAVTWLMLTQMAEWQNAEAEADRLDPRWRLADIEEDRPRIADAENAAFVLLSAKRKGGRVSIIGAPNYDRFFEDVQPTAQLNGQQIQLIQNELNKIPAALAEARTLKDMPIGRFSVKIADDWISTLLPNHQDARELGDWLIHDAYMLAQDDRCDDALDSCRALLNAGRIAGDDRFLISHLIRVALQSMATQAVERVLAQGNASEEKLATLQQLVEREIKESNWSGSIRNERAGAHHMFENIRSGKIKTSMLRGMALGRRAESVSEWVMDTFPSTMLKYYPEFLRRMNELVEISKLPLHEQKPKLDQMKSPRDTGNPVIGLLFPGLDKVHMAELRSQAWLRSMHVGLACERYRLKHDRWPESLDVLVNDKLVTAVPLDPIDGQPLRYRRHVKHIVIYSVGMDAKDNQGHIDRQKIQDPGVDIGFRLWNEAHRRGLEHPPVAILEMPQPWVFSLLH